MTLKKDRILWVNSRIRWFTMVTYFRLFVVLINTWWALCAAWAMQHTKSMDEINLGSLIYEYYLVCSIHAYEFHPLIHIENVDRTLECCWRFFIFETVKTCMLHEVSASSYVSNINLIWKLDIHFHCIVIFVYRFYFSLFKFFTKINVVNERRNYFPIKMGFK